MEKKPLCKLDLETTGTSTRLDRIVSIAILKVDHNFNPVDELKSYLINPLMPIPPGATKCHGITDADVQGKPTFASYARNLFEYLKDCNLSGYNIKSFDVPLLAEEFRRCGYTFPVPGMVFLDTFKIFQRKEPRDLAGAVKFYCKRGIEGAHTADGDVISSLDVLRAQFELYPELKEMTDEQLQLFCSDDRKTLDLAGKIYLNERNEPCYGFGKSENSRVVDDPGFGNWMLKESSDFNTDTKEVVEQILKRQWKLKL